MRFPEFEDFVLMLVVSGGILVVLMLVDQTK